MRTQTKLVLVILFAVVAGIPFACIVGIMGRGCRWAGRAMDVTEAELDPAVLLQRYEWFKNCAAQLNQKLATLKVYEQRLKIFDETPRAQMDRIDKEQQMQTKTELLGLAASYNSLAAEYNAQMAKINWRFTNVGMLPEGTTEPLPREFATYLTE